MKKEKSLEESFFGKRLPKKKAIIKGAIIILIDAILFFPINSIHSFEILPLSLAIVILQLIVFIYGGATMYAPFQYEDCKEYVEKQNFKIDTPNMFLYKKYLIKWGKDGAYVYQKNGIVRWIIHDTTFNNEEEVRSFLDNRKNIDKMFDAIPNSGGN